MISDQPPSTGAVWRIEAGATLQAMLERPDCHPLLARMLIGPLTWHARCRATVEWALLSPGVAPQWFAALLALGATVCLDHDGRQIEQPLDALAGQKPGGQIVALQVLAEGLCWGEARVGRTPADEPIVAAVAAVDSAPDGVVRFARLALTGAWRRPVGLAAAPDRLAGRPLDAAAIAAVAAAVEQEVAPKGDFVGSEEYRRAMAGVLARRALEACLPGTGENRP